MYNELIFKTVESNSVCNYFALEMPSWTVLPNQDMQTHKIMDTDDGSPNSKFLKQKDVISTVVKGHTFTIHARYNLSKSKVLGAGAFGIVISAFDPTRQKEVAIKRIRPYADNASDAILTIREIRLMKHLGNHPNIISLYEVSIFEPKGELYFVMELLDGDLHKVISRSKQPLTERHLKCFMKQLLEGIKAMHSVGVFHRDLKPANILISKNCELRISDFGWSRFMHRSTRHGENRANPMTEYIITRWYRSPELLVAPKNLYDEKIDLWSIGCILAELFLRSPLFPGTTYTDQIIKILKVFGYEDAKELGIPIKADNVAFLDKYCKGPPTDLSKIFKNASSSFLSFIKSLLTLNPYARPTAEEALQHEYLADAEEFYDYSIPYLTPIPPERFAFELQKCTGAELKEMIRGEVSVAEPVTLPTKLLDLQVSSTPGHSSSRGEDGEQHNSSERSSDRNIDHPGQQQQKQQQKPGQAKPKKKDNPFRSKTSGSGSGSGSAESTDPDPAGAETVHRQPRIFRADSDLSAVSELSDVEGSGRNGVAGKNSVTEAFDGEEGLPDGPFDKPLEYSDSDAEDYPPVRYPAKAAGGKYTETAPATTTAEGEQRQRQRSKSELEEEDSPPNSSLQQKEAKTKDKDEEKQKQREKQEPAVKKNAGYGVVPAASPSAVSGEDNGNHRLVGQTCCVVS